MDEARLGPILSLRLFRNSDLPSPKNKKPKISRSRLLALPPKQQGMLIEPYSRLTSRQGSAQLV